MSKIDDLLQSLGLTLSDCEDEWVDKVKLFRNNRAAMTADTAEKREQEIVADFYNYHEIETDEPKPAPAPAAKPKKAQKGIFEFNEEEVMKQADDIIGLI